MNALLLVLLSISAEEEPANDEVSQVVEPAQDDDARPLHFVALEVGMKTVVDTHWSFDKISSADAQPFGSFALSTTVFGAGQFALALGARWEPAVLHDRLRQQDLTHVQQRILASIEGRYHPLRWLYLFVKAAPGAAWQSLSIEDSSAPGGNISMTAWAPALDASGGIAFLALGHKNPGTRHVRWWWIVDAGYAWTGPVNLRLTPSLNEEDHRATAASDLGVLRLQGAFFRIATALSF